MMRTFRIGRIVRRASQSLSTVSLGLVAGAAVVVTLVSGAEETTAQKARSEREIKRDLARIELTPTDPAVMPLPEPKIRLPVSKRSLVGASAPATSDDRTRSQDRKRPASRVASASPGPQQPSAAAPPVEATQVEPSQVEPRQSEQPEPNEWTSEQRIAALNACLKELASERVEIQIADPLKVGDCGSPAMVTLQRIEGPNPVEFRPGVLLNCEMVKALADWTKETLQPVTIARLGSPITRILGGGGYSCRNRNGASTGKLSEHAFANAVDMGTFETADGQTISVLEHWGPTRRDIERRMAEAREREAEKARQQEQAKAQAGKIEAGKALPGKTVDGVPKAKSQEPATDDETTAALPEKHPRRAGSSAPTTIAASARDRNVAPLTERELRREARRIRRELANEDRRQKRRRQPAAKAEAPVQPSAGVPKFAAYLRELHEGACGRFGTVLGPEANEAHRNHFHFDLAARRRSAYCQ